MLTEPQPEQPPSDRSEVFATLRTWAIDRYHQDDPSIEICYWERFQYQHACGVGIENAGSMGHFMIWDNGCFEIDVGSLSDIDDVLRRSGEVATPQDVRDELDAIETYMAAHAREAG